MAGKTFRPKSGDSLTYIYNDGSEVTGVVLDRAFSPMTRRYEGISSISAPLGYFVWVHRADGNFDRVRVHTKSAHTEWCGTYTPGGTPLTRTYWSMRPSPSV